LSETRLVKTPSHVPLSRLSRDLYLRFLKKAKRNGFSFALFRDFLPDAPNRPVRFILLRHDIDFAPGYSLEIAQIEHEAGIRSTFFVLVDGQFYDPVQSDVVRQIRAIHSLGHEIGLHFAVSSAVESDLGKEVAFRLDVLSAIIGARVVSFSQHDVVNAGTASVTLPATHAGCVDAREVIQDNHLLYVSDSAMMWRQFTFETALDQNRNLCLLAHPHSWLYPGNDYIAMIREFQLAETQRVQGNYDAFVDELSCYYERRLREGV